MCTHAESISLEERVDSYPEEEEDAKLFVALRNIFKGFNKVRYGSTVEHEWHVKDNDFFM